MAHGGASGEIVEGDREVRWLVIAAVIAAPVLSERPAAAQDALAAAPRAYTVELENQWVRVLRLKLAPQETTAVHVHPGIVAVLLTDVLATVTTADGTKQPIARQAGDVLYQPGMPPHSEQNMSDQPLEVVVVELKSASPSNSVPVSLDPVTLDPQHHPVLIDNAQVRVIRTILEPHLKSPMHEHPHYVVVYLTELHTTMKMGDGREVDNPRKPGDVAWRDALKHETEQKGDKTAVEIQIELK
jgi:quercetin dioxygenase-like cupin family protein